MLVCKVVKPHLHWKHFIFYHESFSKAQHGNPLCFTIWKILFPFVSKISTSFVNFKCPWNECANSYIRFEIDFQNDDQIQTWSILHYQIDVMGNIKDLQTIRSIFFMISFVPPIFVPWKTLMLSTPKQMTFWAI
jgi:hypothetical protein